MSAQHDDHGHVDDGKVIPIQSKDLKDYFDDPTDGKYTVFDFFTGSTDAKKGHHSVSVRVNIPLYVNAAIMEFVDSSEWAPYKTREAVIRDLIVHGIVMRKEQVKLPVMIARLQAAADRAKVDKILQDALEAERDHRNRLNQLEELMRDVADEGVRIDRLHECHEAAKGMEEPYRTKIQDRVARYLKEFQSRA